MSTNVTRRYKKHLRFCVRSFWGAVLLLIIAIAACVQVGRAVFPVLNDYRGTLGEYMSHRLGVQVSIGTIDAKWRGLRPRFTLLDVALADKAGEPVATVERVEAEIGLLATFHDWRLAFRRLRFYGLQSTLVQNESGFWAVRGLEPTTAGGGDFVVDDPLDIFLFGRRIELIDTALQVQFRSDFQTQVRIPEISLENDDYFHRLAAALRVDGRQVMHLVVEGHGDPRNQRTFDAAGYLQLNDFPTGRVLAALEGFKRMGYFAQLEPEAKAYWQEHGRLSLQLWFNGTARRGLTTRGLVHIDGLPAKQPLAAEWPEETHAEFIGAWRSESGWQLSLVNAQAAWDGFAAPPMNLELRGKLGEPVRVGFESINIGEWSSVLARTGWLPEEAGKWNERLKPAGVLHNAELTWTGKDNGYFQLAGSVVNGGINGWKHIPTVTGVDGYVTLTAFDGQFALTESNGLSLGLATLLPTPVQVVEAQGSLSWSIDRTNKVGYLGSSLLRARDGGGVEAVSRLQLRLPFKPEPENPPEMTLVLGADGCNLEHCLRYLPDVVPQSAAQWLHDSLKSGQVRDFSLLYRGSLLPDTPEPRVVEMGLSFSGAELAFSKDWPALSSAQGHLLLENSELTVTGAKGQISGLDLHDVKVRLRDNPSGAEGRALLLAGEVAGDSAQALRLLQQSPLREPLAEVASWQMEGRVAGHLDLVVPLDASADGAAQSLNLTVNDNRLHLPELDLTFEAVTGGLHYSSEQGLTSHGLETRLWDQPLALTIATHGKADKVIEVDVAGRARVEDLRLWLDRPELDFVAGAAKVEGTLLIPLQSKAPLQAVLRSDLQDVAITLPEPYGKAAGVDLPLVVSFTQQRQDRKREPASDLHLKFADIAELAVRRQGNSVRGIAVGLSAHAEIPKSPSIAVQGRVDRLDVKLWREVWQSYQVASARSGQANDSEPAADLPVRIDLAVEQLLVGDAAIEHLHLTGGQEAGGWVLNAVGEKSAGRVGFFGDKRPVEVDFRRLHLPRSSDHTADSAEQGSASLLADINLDWLPAVDFSAEKVQWGDQALGSWSFKLRPVDRGVTLFDLHGDLKGLSISGKGDAGAELIWIRSPLGQQTYFSGRAKGGDLGRLLKDWGQPEALTSESANFDIELQWPGAPDQINLSVLSGMVAVDLRRGRFIRGADIGENLLLKLVGLLNFDTLARRLRLDFSDLRPEGMGYERVHGSLQFVQGVVSINKPLQVETPSTDLQLAGKIDLLRQQLDARVVVTLPVAGNLTVAAALTGGVPLAVGVYIAGKLFKPQVDKASSARYRIKGGWSEPSVQLEKIFENETD